MDLKIKPLSLIGNENFIHLFVKPYICTYPK